MIDFLVHATAAEIRQGEAPLRAFTANTPAGVWGGVALPVPFAIGLPRSRELGVDEDAEVNVALRAWTGVACTGFRAQLVGTTTAPPGDDGVNAIYFHDDVWPSDLPSAVIATTVVHLDGLGRYHDADVHLNSVNYRFSIDGRPGTVDLRSVLTHEFGHALGLGHSVDARATMYPSYGSPGAWRSIEGDDKTGICSLYPGVGLVQGCDALPCPASHLCIAGVCERAGAQATVCAPCDRVPGACEAAGDDARCVDLPLGGRVCGRACAGSSECGAGFRCEATSSSGDLQCVSNDACTTGPDLSGNDADGPFGVCSHGACVGRVVPVDAGGAEPIDSGAEPTTRDGSGCSAGSEAPGDFFAGVAPIAALMVRRRR